MRRITATLATLALAGLGATVPASGAQAASAHCDEKWNNTRSGLVVAYGGANCYGDVLGWTESWDSDWGNSSGPFEHGDTNEATSVLHKGTSGYAVQFFNDTGQDWTGGHSCLKKSEKYASDLSDNYFTVSNGAVRGVNNAISSHRWVPENKCDKFMT
ncbi:hypothetical protein ACFV2X_02895 [Streptomyces sp. NPDC059679]|uniref:hypothetical protein n=1 Tax=Streptomyces sp. NPDC059679 TaxID=3346903 RepID=UPI0036C24159